MTNFSKMTKDQLQAMVVQLAADNAKLQQEVDDLTVSDNTHRMNYEIVSKQLEDGITPEIEAYEERIFDMEKKYQLLCKEIITTLEQSSLLKVENDLLKGQVEHLTNDIKILTDTNEFLTSERDRLINDMIDHLREEEDTKEDTEDFENPFSSEINFKKLSLPNQVRVVIDELYVDMEELEEELEDLEDEFVELEEQVDDFARKLREAKFEHASDLYDLITMNGLKFPEDKFSKIKKLVDRANASDDESISNKDIEELLNGITNVLADMDNYIRDIDREFTKKTDSLMKVIHTIIRTNNLKFPSTALGSMETLVKEIEKKYNIAEETKVEASDTKVETKTEATDKEWKPEEGSTTTAIGNGTYIIKSDNVEEVMTIINDLIKKEMGDK